MPLHWLTAIAPTAVPALAQLFAPRIPLGILLSKVW